MDASAVVRVWMNSVVSMSDAKFRAYTILVTLNVGDKLHMYVSHYCDVHSQISEYEENRYLLQSTICVPPLDACG